MDQGYRAYCGWGGIDEASCTPNGCCWDTDKNQCYQRKNKFSRLSQISVELFSKGTVQIETKLRNEFL